MFLKSEVEILNYSKCSDKFRQSAVSTHKTQCKLKEIHSISWFLKCVQQLQSPPLSS